MEQYGYKTYLATKVLSEGQVVTYRTLSRALKIHVNHAKRMLYAFHTTQTTKNPQSVHATYLICGTIRPLSTASQKAALARDEDVVMDSSPVPSSWMQQEETQVIQDDDEDEEEGETFNPEDADVPTKHVVLVRQEDLEDVQKEFDQVEWIHIYSLQKASPTDIYVLGHANEVITKAYARDMLKNPLDPIKGIGIIPNPKVKWRELKNTSVAKATATVAANKAVIAASKPVTIPALSRESSTTSNKATTSATAKGSIMSSFAKGQGQAKKPAATAKPAVKKEDVKMKDAVNFSDDDDEDDEDMDNVDTAAIEANAAKAAESRKEKAAREAKLKAMLDDDEDDSDTEMKDAPAPAPVIGDEPDDEQVEEVDDSAALDTTTAKSAAPQQSNVTVDNGRRRGKRQVKKKKTYEDEDGYLVTKEEMEWESFSEDEVPVPPKQENRTLKRTATGSEPAGSLKKKGGIQPPKQGNIMSFFGKK